MRVHLKTLKLICKRSEEIISFSRNITFIHGELSLGKSSVARLVDFCLGGKLEQTTAIQRELLGAQLSLLIGEHDVLIERSKDASTVRVSWQSTGADPEQVTIRVKGDGPPAFDDIVNLSDLIFHLLGLPIMRVRKRTGDENSPMVRLSFRDLLKFCYLEQEHLDSSFFLLASPILQEKSKDALNFFAGYYSATLSDLENRLDQLRSDQRAKREAAQRIQEFLARFGFASVDDIQRELDSVGERSASLSARLQDDTNQFSSDTLFADDRRDALRRLTDQLEREKQALVDVEDQVGQQQELRAELYSMKFKAARAGRARLVLERSQFSHCPNCGQTVSETRAASPDDCYLCLQPSAPSDALNVSAIDDDLDARITDLDASLKRHTRARDQQKRLIEEVSRQKRKLDGELSELISVYETDRLVRTRDAERQLAQLGERGEFLERVKAMPDAVWTMLNEADSLSGEIDKAVRLIEQEQKRLSVADENFAALEENFLKALIAVQVPGVSPLDKVFINRRSLIPEVWPAGRQQDAYTFFSAGSGGKKTLFTICFALALHQTAAVRKLPVPTILIIDTPLKNITPDINPELVKAFYEYLYEVAERDLRHQVIIIDQMLVAPPPESELDFSSRLMTRDDPKHPPLISYYNGP